MMGKEEAMITPTIASKCSSDVSIEMKKEVETDDEGLGKRKAYTATEADKNLARAEEAVKALEELKGYLGKIMDMNESDLKALCKEKKIMQKGRNAMKYKYMYILLADALANGTY
jgi:hypothetical protein